jgi:hypothetical protein
MIQQLGEKWRAFRRRANDLLLAMDADPLQDIYRRLRQLEAANRQSEAGRPRAVRPTVTDEVP